MAQKGSRRESKSFQKFRKLLRHKPGCRCSTHRKLLRDHEIWQLINKPVYDAIDASQKRHYSGRFSVHKIVKAA